MRLTAHSVTYRVLEFYINPLELKAPYTELNNAMNLNYPITNTNNNHHNIFTHYFSSVYMSPLCFNPLKGKNNME